MYHGLPCTVLVCACEGKEQRDVPIGKAVGDNEIKQHRNFSEKHFLGVVACEAVRDGDHDRIMPRHSEGKPIRCTLPS